MRDYLANPALIDVRFGEPIEIVHEGRLTRRELRRRRAEAKRKAKP